MKHHGLPASASQMREALGEDFVEDFSRRLEKVGVDVIRVPDLSTAYSVVLMERPVVVVPTTGNWFYTNWSIAHELGHLALGHEGATPDNRAIGELEAQANAFAADLLLPRVLLDRVDWSRSDFASVARFLWDSGVSTTALRNRLAHFHIQVSPELVAALESTTQRFLRKYWDTPAGDPVTHRMTESARRRFPDWLKTAHLEKIGEGKLGKGTLAWMLGVDEDELEVGEPEPEDPSAVETHLDAFLR